MRAVGRGRALAAAAGALVAGLWLGCGGDGAAGSTVTALEPYASIEGAPLSGGNDLVLLESEQVCVADTYEKRVSCAAADRPTWWSFGSEGAGPGEFRSLIRLERARVDGRELIAVVDWILNRMSLFSRTGELVRDVRVPPTFMPIATVGPATAWGIYIGFEPGPIRGKAAEVRLSDTEVTRRFQLHGPGEEPGGVVEASDEPRYLRAVLTPDSVIFAHDRGYVFTVFSLAGEVLGTVRYPERLQQPVYPTEAEVEQYARDMRSFGGPASEAQLEEFRSTPKPPVRKGVLSLRIGPDGGVWVPSVRETPEATFIDLFGAEGYRRTVSVPGKLLAFDILGDRLATLVVPPDDELARRVDLFDLTSP